MEVNRVFRQSLRSEPPGNFATQDCAHHAIGVADRKCRLDLFPTLQGRRSQVKQHLVVERVLQPVILRDLTVLANVRANIRLIENRRII